MNPAPVSHEHAEASLVRASELGVLLRPDRPFGRHTIIRWTREGRFPRHCLEFRGCRVWYSVPKLIAANVLLPRVPAALPVAADAAASAVLVPAATG